MKILPFLFAATLCVSGLWSSPPTQAPQGDLERNSGLIVYPGSNPGDIMLSWWGYDEHFYFIETSEDLQEWTLMPTVELGEDQAITLGFNFTADKLFWRLRYSDDPESELLSADLNGIGVSAWDQLQLGYNPFDWVDTDENDLHDAWEMHFFGNLGVDPGADPNDSGLSNADAFALGADPTVDESADPALRENFTYDDRGWLTHYQPTAGASRNFDFDAEGNLTEGQ